MGVAFHNIALGVGIGIAMGVALAPAFGIALLKKNSAKDKPSEEDKKT